MPVTRREFVAAALFNTRAHGACDDRRLITPYKLGRFVLLGSGKPGDFDSISVDCPFVFRHANLFYMTYVAFDGTGYQTGLASSANLIDWHKEGCILPRDPNSPVTRYNIAMNWILRENDLYSSGRLVAINGEFVGAYHAYPNAGYEQGAAVIGLCRSRDLRRWTVEPSSLHPSDGSRWEQGGLYKPCLVRNEGKYYLFYNAKDQATRGWHEQTGVAFSPDLKIWNRYEQNPVIRNGPPGSMDSRFASDPCVLKNGREWAIYYYGLDDRGVARDLVATSPDLLRATKCDRPIVDIGPPGSIDAAYAHKPSVIAHRGDLYHFYCAVSRTRGKETRGISVARSRPWT